MLGESLTTIILAALVGLFVLFVVVKSTLRRHSNLPPGPTYIPILGTYHVLFDNPLGVLSKLPAKYGPVVRLPRDKNPMIVLSSSAAVYDAFDRRRTDFDEREMTQMNGWKSGLFMKNPPQWTLNRKQTIRLLYQYGMQLQRLDLMIADEMEKMRTEWDKRAFAGVAVINPRLDFNIFALNLNGRVIFSRSASYGKPSEEVATTNQDDELNSINLDQENFKRMLTVASHAMSVTLLGQFSMFFSYRQWLPSYRGLVREIRETRRQVDGYVQEIYAQHMLNDHSSDAVPNDLTDHLCQEEKQLEGGAVERQKFRNNAVEILTDLFEAALDVTPTMAYWLGYFLVRYPEEQKHIRSEILSLAEEGTTRPPSLNDYQRMSYTRAFVYEAMRVSNIILNYPGHVAVRDTKICGYDVPKGAAVVINVVYLHSCPGEYDEPKQFRTSRFLTKDGEFVGTSRKLFSFGHGTRACIGEDVALKILVLMVSLLVYHYELCVPEGAEKLPDASDPLVKGIAQCRDYEFALRKRNV